LLGELKLSNIQLEEVNQQLVEKNKQLLALDKAKSEFLNIISHEIKTPLNGIVGLTRLLASQIEGEKYRKYFQALKISVDRLEEFAQNAIFLTELETQSYKCSKHNVMLRDIIQDAIHELRNKLKESKIEIEITTNPKNISLYTDQNLLRRSLTVLIDNAIRFSPDGSKIKIEGNRTNDLVALSVSDKGPGFSEQAISLMFKHFGIGEAHYDQHIGLGLSLVKLSMNLIGGEIEVSSTVGGGAIVTMSFQA
jgi:two-component system sensor histidine kinase/response regulator